MADDEIFDEPVSTPPRSLVSEHKPAAPAAARAYFTHRLTMETDVSDVFTDLKSGVTTFVLVDARGAEAYAQAHIPGAYNLPYRQMDRQTVETGLPLAKVFIVYGAGPHCNAAHKAAIRLSAFGYRLKEMLGGLDGWQRNGYPVATGGELGTLE